MQDELKSKWIQALKSGDYTQGHGALRDLDDSYCCLGVLLDVSQKGEWVDKDEYDNYASNHVYQLKCDDETARDELDLSQCVLDTLGLGNQEQARLVEMNDDDGANFEEIAEWIEENV